MHLIQQVLYKTQKYQNYLSKYINTNIYDYKYSVQPVIGVEKKCFNIRGKRKSGSADEINAIYPKVSVSAKENPIPLLTFLP